MLRCCSYTHKLQRDVYGESTLSRKKSGHVRTNIVIDENLIAAGLKVTGLKTRRELVDFALRDLLRRNAQRALMELKGSVRWEGDLGVLRGAESK